MEKFKNDAQALVKWYNKNQRRLPWRESKNPYFIWVSEVMLQQTTVAAVVPFFERFISRFPTVQSLAEAPIEDVLELWSGLGYYSRARNLHKAAQILKIGSFPKQHTQLMELPGLGPYTARAVTSIAFGDPAGVVDGNVIRVLCRRWGLSLEWWKNKQKDQLQVIADHLVKFEDPSLVNQGLMELGATVCSREKPVCGLCPWNKVCVAAKKKCIDVLPLSKPKKKKVLWLYQPKVIKKNGKLLLVKNASIPVLGRMWMLPGKIGKIPKKPKDFDFIHSVTDHTIYVVPEKNNRNKALKAETQDAIWVPIETVGKYSQSSLTQKVLKKQTLV